MPLSGPQSAAANHSIFHLGQGRGPADHLVVTLTHYTRSFTTAGHHILCFLCTVGRTSGVLMVYSCNLMLSSQRLTRVVVALDFDPDRWLDERLHKYLTPNPFIFLPFNAGPRICLGQQVLSFLCPAVILAILTYFLSSHTMKSRFSSLASCKVFLLCLLLQTHNPDTLTRQQTGQRHQVARASKRSWQNPI